MKMKSAAFIVVCLCAGFFVNPVWADDAASKAVKQCFLNMQSVHSYRTKLTVHFPDFEDKDMNTVSENTEVPRIRHEFYTFSSGKSEDVLTNGTSYVRDDNGAWTIDASNKPSRVPWNSSWLQNFEASANYVFVRKCTLGIIPMNIYVTTRVQGGDRKDTEIWIGANDHLPYKIIRRTTNANGRLYVIAVDTLSDFNVPIKITIPNVMH